LSTNNLPTPVISDPSEHFDIQVYAGSTSEITLTPSCRPDFTWIKAIDKVENHVMFDRVRGSYNASYLNRLTSSTAGVEGYGDAKEFTTDGITLATNSGGSSANGYNYVAWNWKA
jgi:hypothetical protein